MFQKNRLFGISLVVVLGFGSVAAAQSQRTQHEVPAPQQPAPSVPDLGTSLLNSSKAATTYSVLSTNNFIPNGLRQENESDAPGTQAVQKDVTHLPMAPQSPAASLPPALHSLQLDGGLRPLPDEAANNSANNVQAGRGPVGDARLGYDTPPRPPQSNQPYEDVPAAARVLDSSHVYDRSGGAPYPPISGTPNAQENRPWNDGANRQAGRTGEMQRGQVQPVNYLAPVSNGQANGASKQWIDEALANYSIDRAPDPLPGRPVGLLELLKTTPGNLRYAVVNKYWETYEEWALLRSSAEKLRWLESNLQVTSPADRALIDTAKASVANRVMESRIRLKEAQASLHQMARVPSGELLPLPSDPPLAKTFQTHFEYFAARRPMAPVLKTLNETMPETLELIGTRAGTIRMARAALNQNRNGLATGQASVSSVLTAVDLWSRAEADLIRSVGKYNRSTAQYAFNFRPNQSNTSLVKMLIGTRKPMEASSLPVSRTAQVPSINRQSPSYNARPRINPNIDLSASTQQGLTPNQPVDNRLRSADRVGEDRNFGQPPRNGMNRGGVRPSNPSNPSVRDFGPAGNQGFGGVPQAGSSNGGQPNSPSVQPPSENGFQPNPGFQRGGSTNGSATKFPNFGG